MVLRKRTLFCGYMDKSFKAMNHSLYHQYYYYMIILIEASILLLSVLFSFDFLALTLKNIGVVATIVLPFLYFLFKSFKGLILLNDSYNLYHSRLIKQFPLLYVWAYNILIATLFNTLYTTSFIYLLECVIIILLSYLFYNFTKPYKHSRINEDIKKFNQGNFFMIEKYNPIKEIIIFSAFILGVLLIGFNLISIIYDLSFFYYLLTYLFMVIITYLYFYDSYNEPYVLLEIQLMHLGLKNCPEDIIGSMK